MLLELKIPSDQLDAGSATVGATSDVLSVYRKIAESGGLVIAAHANSSNGVAMRGFNFGGQTKIAYTQDANLHALEVTDLDHKGPGSTAAFFNGTKPEYARRMHCIQGSDCHRLTADSQRKKNLGVGDRATDVLLPEASFEALCELFMSNDFARTRPHRPTSEPAIDYIRAARDEGANIIQDFHENMSMRGGKRFAIITDVCAFANTNGGTLYIGLSDNPKEPVIGIQDLQPSLDQIEKEIDNRISPPLDCTIDTQETGGKKILRLLVPRGDDPPYAVDDNKIYIRSEAETNLAVRDEIVSLVLRSSRHTIPTAAVEKPEPVIEKPARETAVYSATYAAAFTGAESGADAGTVVLTPQTHHLDVSEIPVPRTGVEVVSVEERKGDRIFTLRDLRNGNVVKNVTRGSARRLWHYAITNYNTFPADLSQADIYWQGNMGLVKQYKQGNNHRYDLILRQGSEYRYYFGVTEDGIQGPWFDLVGLTGGEDEENTPA